MKCGIGDGSGGSKKPTLTSVDGRPPALDSLLYIKPVQRWTQVFYLTRRPTMTFRSPTTSRQVSSGVGSAEDTKRSTHSLRQTPCNQTVSNCIQQIIGQVKIEHKFRQHSRGLPVKNISQKQYYILTRQPTRARQQDTL